MSYTNLYWYVNGHSSFICDNRQLVTTQMFIRRWISKQTRVVEYSVQLLSHVWLFATPWTTARQASRSPPRPMTIESVMPSNHLLPSKKGSEILIYTMLWIHLKIIMLMQEDRWNKSTWYMIAFTLSCRKYNL